VNLLKKNWRKEPQGGERQSTAAKQNSRRGVGKGKEGHSSAQKVGGGKHTSQKLSKKKVWMSVLGSALGVPAPTKKSRERKGRERDGLPEVDQPQGNFYSSQQVGGGGGTKERPEVERTEPQSESGSIKEEEVGTIALMGK